MAEISMNHFPSEVPGGAEQHAVILRTCVITPKNKKAYTVKNNFIVDVTIFTFTSNPVVNPDVIKNSIFFFCDN